VFGGWRGLCSFGTDGLLGKDSAMGFPARFPFFFFFSLFVSPFVYEGS
jgi:hypothetical protein